MKRIYFRCNGGHYFTGTTCPADGWSPIAADGSNAFEQVLTVATDIAAGAVQLTIPNLLERGADPDALTRVLIVECLDTDSCPDYLEPEIYVIEGQKKRIDKRFL